MITYSVYGQGGGATYRFLDLPVSARSAAMGGKTISVRDNDINFVADNPALLSKSMDQHLSLSYINYVSDINFGYATYARHYENTGTFSAGLHYINYGKFTAADNTGLKTGEFTAGEYNLNLSYAKPLDTLFSIGGSFKTIWSNLEEYQSFGLAADLGGSYLSANKLFSAGLTMKNIGSQLKAYSPDNREQLPFEIQAAVSKKVQHAPFRITILARNLQKWDLTYPKLDDNTTQQPDKKDRLITADKLMRHMVFAVEFLPSDNVFIIISHNYKRRQELKLSSRGGMAGYSFGAGIRVAKFHIGYGLASYHVGGASHHFTVTTNLSDFYSRSDE